MLNSCSNCKIKKKINLISLVSKCSNVTVAGKKMHPVLQCYKVCDKNYKKAIKLKQDSTPIAGNIRNNSRGNVVLSYSNSNNNDNKVHQRRIKSNQIYINIKVNNNNNSVKHLNCVSSNYYNVNGVNRRCNYNYNYNYKYQYKNAFSLDRLPVINNKHTILTQGNSNNYKRNYDRNSNKERYKGFEIENSFISEIQSIIEDYTNTNTNTRTNSNSNNNNGLHIIYSKKRDIINTNRPTTSYAHIKLKNNLRTKSLSPN